MEETLKKSFPVIPILEIEDITDKPTDEIRIIANKLKKEERHIIDFPPNTIYVDPDPEFNFISMNTETLKQLTTKLMDYVLAIDVKEAESERARKQKEGL